MLTATKNRKAEHPRFVGCNIEITFRNGGKSRIKAGFFLSDGTDATIYLGNMNGNEFSATEEVAKKEMRVKSLLKVTYCRIDNGKTETVTF